LVIRNIWGKGKENSQRICHIMLKVLPLFN
jgi:hypothetical protein